MSFWELLFTLIGIYLLYKLFRFLWIVVWPIAKQIRIIRKAQKDFYRTAQENPETDFTRQTTKVVYKDGDITVEETQIRKKKIKDERIGEYTDFEEL